MPIVPARFFCDTSYFYACLDARDKHCLKAREIAQYTAANRLILCTTWDIISETITLLRYHLNYEMSLRFIEEVVPLLELIYLDASVHNAAIEVFKKTGRKIKLSYCDALSFVAVTTVLDNVPCLSFDSDFQKLGLNIFRLPGDTTRE